MSHGKAYLGDQVFDVVYVDRHGWRFFQPIGSAVLLDDNGRVSSEPTLTISQFAHIVQWPRDRIVERIQIGKIKAVKQGGKFEIPKTELMGYRHGQEYLRTLADGRSEVGSA